MTGTGANPAEWCEALHTAIDLACGWTRPFWQCNDGGDGSRARVDPDLGVYLANGWTGNVEFHDGINARFDWWGWWEPRDAMHDCVAEAIRLSTCRGVDFAGGLRCIPVLYAEPDSGVSDCRPLPSR